MHEVEHVVREGRCWGVLTDHAKVPMEIDLSIHDDKENVETIKPATAFSDMAED